MSILREPYRHSSRCVNCGYPKDRHHEGLCPGSGGSKNKNQMFSTMNLPEGKTCADCVHTARCVAIFGHIPEDETCDWLPIRYQERQR